MANVWSEAPRRGVVARAQVTSVADVRAIERTPFLELLPSWTILGMIEHAAEAAPDKTAIVVLDKGDPTLAGRHLTYAELAATIRVIASQLHEHHVRCDIDIAAPLLHDGSR